MKIAAFLNKPSAHVLLISLLGLLAYSNTFDVPFQFDDMDYIVKNPIVKDSRYLFASSDAEGISVSKNVGHARKTRIMGLLSFWLNYRLHGLEVKGYHIFNLAIHLLNALLLYLLVGITFRTPLIKSTLTLNPSPDGRGAGGAGKFIGDEGKFIVFFSALLFVAHPVQTQAVTYTTQRFASLAALFYIGSLVFYVKWKLSNPPLSPLTLRGEYILVPPFSKGGVGGLFYQGGLFYLLALLFAVLAMNTKENAFTLPAALLLYETVFFGAPSRRRLLGLIPFALTMLIIPLNIIGVGGLDGATRADTQMPRLDYLFTQFRVIVTYLRLLVLPINQNLLYDYPAYTTFRSPAVFLSFIFLLSLFTLGVYLLYRSWRSWRSDVRLRVIAFGIFWFFLTLSVESSIIPTQDMIFEHRLYLPAMGVFLAFTSAYSMVAEKTKSRKTRLFALMLFILPIFIFTVATYKRNAIWRDEISLWEDTSKKNPNNAVVQYNLALAYLTDKGSLGKSIEHFLMASALNPDNPDPHLNIGNAYLDMGMLDRAIVFYQKALSLRPDYPEVHAALGNAYYSMGMADDAIVHYEAALKQRPSMPEAHNNLGIALKNKGMIDAAIEHYLSAIRLKPDFGEAHFNLANAYDAKGLIDGAIEHYRAALDLSPEDAEIHYSLGRSYLAKGLINEARLEIEQALRIKPGHPQAEMLLHKINTSP